jgi:CHAT domain-containing protein/Tfp pilus assembly protein PilF
MKNLLKRMLIGFFLLAVVLPGSGVFSPIWGQSEQPGKLSREERVQLEADLKEAFQSGLDLFQEGSEASLKKALLLFENAGKLARQLGDKEQETLTNVILGRINSELGEQKKALEYYEQALLLNRMLGDSEGEAKTLMFIGAVYSDLGDQKKALEYYEQAVRLTRELGDRDFEARTLNTIGLVYYSLGEKEKALEYYVQVLPLWLKVGDRGIKAETLTGIGNVSSDLGEKNKALGYYQQALPLFRAVGNRGGEAKTLMFIGEVYSDLGEQKKALEYLEQTLPIFRAVGDRRGEATTLRGIGVLYSILGEKKKALEYLEQALALFRSVAERGGEAATLSRIGLEYYNLGEMKKALEYYEEALPLSRAVGDRGGEALTLSGIGSVYSNFGQRKKALEYYELALSLSRSGGDRGLEATMLNNSGGEYSALGDKKKALEYYEQALSLSRSEGGRAGDAATLNNIGLVNSELGEKKKALQYYEQALTLLRAAGDRGGSAKTLYNIGLLYSDIGVNKKALEYYEQALSLSRSVGDRGGEATTLTGIGQVFYALGEQKKALEYYEQALPVLRVVGDNVGEATTLHDIGAVYSYLGDLKKALEYYEQALPLWRAVGDRRGEAKTLSNIGFCFPSRKHEILIFFEKQSLNRLQGLRGLALGLEKDTQQAFLKSIEIEYRILADLLFTSGRVPEGLEVLRMLKEDEFYDFTTKSKDDISWLSAQATLTLAESKAEKSIEDGLKPWVALISEQTELFTAESRGELTEAQKKRKEALPGEIEQARSNFRAAREQVEKDLQAAPTSVTPKSVTDLQASLGKINAVTVFTLVGEKKLHLVLVTPQGLTYRSTDIATSDVEKLISYFRNVLTDKYSDDKPAGKALYDLLVKPLNEELGKLKPKTLMWALDGRLRYIPMAALWDGEHYLVERFETPVYTIEPKTLESLASNAKWTGLGAGVSQAHGDFQALVNVPKELNAVIRTSENPEGKVAGELLQDETFTEVSFRGKLGKGFQLVHVASHFKFSEKGINDTGLLLGDGSLLTLARILEGKDLFKGVDLLTLSACETAIGSSDRAGSEIEGMAVVAQRQGAQGVLASLWKVDDPGTARLMAAFYRIRESKPGITKARALQLAQQEILGKGVDENGLPRGERAKPGIETLPQSGTPATRLDHPYYWAPFILIGNWQ